MSKLFLSTLPIFAKLSNNPSLRALAGLSRSELQLKTFLDCFTSFAKTALFSLFSKMAKVQFLVLSLLFIYSFLISAAESYAAKPLSLSSSSINELKKTFTFLGPNQSLINTSPDTLAYLSSHTDSKQVNHLRMQQMYLGFPVYGGQAIIHSQLPIKKQALFSQEAELNGVVYEGLALELGAMPVDYLSRQGSVLQAFKSQFSLVNSTDEQIKPIIYMDELNHAHWAYELKLFINHADRGPERQAAILDADSGIPFMRWNDLKTERRLVSGKGFGGNSMTGQYQFGQELPFLSISRDDFRGICYMDNRRVGVIDMHQSYSLANDIMNFDCLTEDNNLMSDYWTGYLGDGYDKKNQAYSPTNDALYVGGIVYQMYHDWYHTAPLMNGKKPLKLIMRVHYGTSYENAFWDGKQMTFGDGGNRMYPLVSLDIAAHEISHGFTEQHANLNYYGQSGALNESFSDMASQAATFYAKGFVNWNIAPEIMKPSSRIKALRYMNNPSVDGHSIESALDYHSGMDVHHSSGVYNRLFYLLATQPGWDVHQAFDVMVKANMDYWTPTTNFEQAACGVIKAAQDLDLNQDTVKQVLDLVDVDYDECH